MVATNLNRLAQDEQGASLSIALLLFLVCAVVSTVVLAAGTAASGRMSQSVESDQRYYAVTSAAEYIKNQLQEDIANDQISLSFFDRRFHRELSADQFSSLCGKTDHR